MPTRKRFSRSRASDDTDFKPLTQIAGYVGSDPEERDGRDGDSFTSFSVAVNRSYGDDDDSTRWYSVAVNKPALQDFVLETIRKGSAVVVEGTASKNTKNDVTYHNLSGYRVGLVDWFVAGSDDHDRDDEDL